MYNQVKSGLNSSKSTSVSKSNSPTYKAPVKKEVVNLNSKPNNSFNKSSNNYSSAPNYSTSNSNTNLNYSKNMFEDAAKASEFKMKSIPNNPISTNSNNTIHSINKFNYKTNGNISNSNASRRRLFGDRPNRERDQVILSNPNNARCATTSAPNSSSREYSSTNTNSSNESIFRHKPDGKMNEVVLTNPNNARYATTSAPNSSSGEYSSTNTNSSNESIFRHKPDGKMNEVVLTNPNNARYATTSAPNSSSGRYTSSNSNTSTMRYTEKDKSNIKSYDELCKMYNTTFFDDKEIVDMYKKGYINEELIEQLLKDKNTSADALSVLIKDGYLDSDSARKIVSNLNRDDKANLYQDGAERYEKVRERYRTIADKNTDKKGKTLDQYGEYMSYSKVVEKEDGTRYYYNKNKELIKSVTANGSVYFQQEGVYYSVVDDNTYRIIHNVFNIEDTFTINPKYVSNQVAETYYSDGTVATRSRENDVTVTVYGINDGEPNKSEFYRTVESDNELISESYHYRRDYNYQSDYIKHNEEEFNKYVDGLDKTKSTEQYKQEYKDSYEIISKVADTSSDKASIFGGKTMWFDGKMHEYSSRKKLDDGSIQYELKDNIGSKVVKPDGTIIASYNFNNENSYTSTGLHSYKANSDGTYSITDPNRRITYGESGYDVYSVKEYDIVGAEKANIEPVVEFSTHKDY